MTFRVGQKVVCVDARPLSDGRPNPFKCGEIQTIADISECVAGEGCVGFDFLGVGRIDDGRWGYCSARWRPVFERKTDISALKSLLVPDAKIRERA